jgi:hypothetical protein
VNKRRERKKEGMECGGRKKSILQKNQRKRQNAIPVEMPSLMPPAEEELSLNLNYHVENTHNAIINAKALPWGAELSVFVNNHTEAKLEAIVLMATESYDEMSI